MVFSLLPRGDLVGLNFFVFVSEISFVQQDRNNLFHYTLFVLESLIDIHNHFNKNRQDVWTLSQDCLTTR